MKYLDAEEEDLPEIIRLLIDDSFGEKRESLSKKDFIRYEKAFWDIKKSSTNKLIVLKDNEYMVATMQLTLIPSLTFLGSTRLQIEGIRVSSLYRGKGFGKKMIQWAILFAKDNNCHIIQLTRNKERKRALTFYENCGFKASHEGFKLYLTSKR